MLVDMWPDIADEATTVTHRRRSGSYDADGKWNAGAAVDTLIQAVVLPVNTTRTLSESSYTLQDKPEGERIEADYLIWTPTPIANDDEIVFSGVTWRVMLVQDLTFHGGFTRGGLARK